MKNTLRLAATVAAIFFLAVFSGCQMDDAEHEHESHTGIAEKYITLEELKKIPEATAIVDKINNGHRNDAKGKNVYYGEHDFFVATTKILRITNGNYHSFTFPIWRLGGTDVTENLVLSSRDDGKYDVSIYSYDLSANEKEHIRQDLPVAITGKIKHRVLEGFNPDQLFGKTVQYSYSEIVYVPCGEGVHHGGNVGSWGGCKCLYALPSIYVITRNTMIEVPDDWNGGSGEAGDGSGGGPGVGGGPNYNPNIPAFNPDTDFGAVKGNLTRPIIIPPSKEQIFYNSLDDDGNPASIVLSPLQRIMQDKTIREPLLEFLDQNDYSEEACETAEDILQYVVDTEDREFAVEILNMTLQEEEADQSLNLLSMTITAKSNGYFDSPLDANYCALIDSHTEANLQGPEHEIWVTMFTVKCAILRFQHPSWSKARIYWEASKEMIHLALDIVGLVPVVGEIADLANGAIYTIEGDGVNATLSYASAIPVAGWFAAGIKFAKRADGLTFIVKANDLITFGARNSKKFRQACGLSPGDPRQAHHLISRATDIIEHPVVQRAAKATGNQGFHIDDALNGVAVAAWRNQPNHNVYNSKIFDKLETFIINNPNATPQQCYDQLMIILNQAKQAIINNPNVHLNNLNF